MLKHTQPRLSQLASAVAVVLGGITLLPAAHAAAAPAGVSISNIAVASYTDATGAPQTVNSNEVRTTVLQVASFTLVAPRTATVNPNGQVALSHTLTNTGNGTDTFTLALINNAAGDTTDLNNIAIYIDANGDGVADNTTNLAGQTVTLPAGQSVNLIVVGTAPINSTNGQTAQLTISATTATALAPSQQVVNGGAGPTASNIDTVTITGDAIVNVTKSASVTTANVGSTVEYTLTYSNTGNTTATDLVIRDLLPANVTYVTGSARWSNTAPTALTEADDAASLPASGDRFSFGVSAAREVSFAIPSLPANTTGTLRFRVTIDAAAPAGAIVNQGQFSYDANGPTAGGAVPEAPTNNSTVTVNSSRLGTINDSATDPYSDAQRVPGDEALNDTQTVAVLPQGGTTSFPVYVHNTGNVSQVYEVTVNSADLPAGSSVQVLRNGAPLTNITGTTAVDVGPIAVGGVAELSVVITLPAGFSETGLDTSDTIITISPVGNELAVDRTTLVIGDITAARVDLTNGAAGLLYDNIPANDITADGEGPYLPGTIVDSLPTTPGVAVEFPVEIFNGGNSPDNFNLTATVPAGFTVVFLDPVTRQVVTNSGNVAPGATRDLIAVVTPANNALVDPTNDVVLTVTSPVSGLSDSIKNNIAITEVRALNLTPDRQGQVAPGGTVTYVHTLRNNGNVTEGDVLGELPIAVTTTGSIGSVVTVGIDLNADGELQNNEIVQNNDLNSVLPTGLAPFTSYTVLVKVQAPGSAQPGQEDITTVRINPTGAINGVLAPASVQIIDTTSVTAGQIRVVKTQALDANCDGIELPASYIQGVISAQPGQCVVYRIVATNEGNAPVTNVVITDATPAFTTIDTIATATVGSIATPALAVGDTGTVTNNVGSLAPAATAQLDFGVQIDD